MNKLLFLLLSLLTVIYSCKDSETFVPDPSEQAFKASAFVQVVDLNGDPIKDVLVKTIHGQNAPVTNNLGATNADGVLFLDDVDMHTSTYISVSKAGYFHGSRRFYPAAGKVHAIRIMLMDEHYIGSVTNASGGTINVDGKVTLTFPANAVVTESGQVYSGEVRVSAQPISADDADLSDKMPGNLVGIKDSGTKGALGSLGMVAVELTAANGDLLQLKSGSTVEMKLKVPNAKLSTAPSVIPMWYFDETAGYWKEDGEATLVGNEYVAQLPHFSFWNCDAWFDLVDLTATFLFDNGAPALQALVCINIISLNTSSCAFTNEDGVVTGAVAANEIMLMEIRNGCDEVLFSQQIGPYTDDVVLGPFTIPSTNIDITTVTGNAVDCNGDPVTAGFAGIKMSDQTVYVRLDDTDGTFGLTAANCDQANVVVTAYDEVALKQSVTATFPYAVTIDAGTLTACEDLTELVDVEIIGLPDHYLYHFPDMWIQGNNTVLNTADSSSNLQYFYVNIPGTTTGTYLNTQSEVGFTLPNGDRGNAFGIDVTITYYGAVGDYINGTFSGTLHTTTQPGGQTGPDYPIQGSFTVLRE